MSLLSLPDQTIPDVEKTKDWHIQHARQFATFSLSSQYNDERKNMLKYYRAYNAELSEEEQEAVKRVTCPEGIDLGIPYIVYPLIQTKVEQIVGEFLLRPIRRKAYVINKKAKNAKFEEKLKMISEEIMRDFAKKMEKDLGFVPTTENPKMDLPPDIEEFFEKDFKMLAEEVADNLMALFLDVRKEKHKLKELFIDYCITDRCHAILDKKHGHTTMRKVHPLDADYDLDPYHTVQRNHEYFFETYWLTENEIYNSFSLTRQQKAEVKEMFENLEFGLAQDSEELGVAHKYDGWYDASNKKGRIRLVNAMWKSRKRTNIKVSDNKQDGSKVYKVIKEEDIRKRDKVEHIDGEEPRFVQMLGPNICLDWGVMEQRFSSVDNPYECELPVISIVRDNTTGTSQIKSVAAKLYQLQEMASEALFEIRSAMKHAGDSRVLVYDVAQIPKQFTKGGASGLNRVFHHIKKDKMMLINSAQKGPGSKQSFNQFTSLDLSQKGAIKDLFEGLAIIEDLASKFVGITPEREGQVGQYQTAGGTDAAIRGSAARTEVIYSPFDDFVQHLLEKVLLKMKKDYPEGEVMQFIFGDMKTKFIKLFKDFFESDFGVHLSDARKDKEAADKIDNAAIQALSTANTPELIMGLIEVFEGESASEKKAVFARMLNSMEKIRQENLAAAKEQAAQAAQSEQAKADKDLLKSRETNEKDVTVANIYADNKSLTDNLKINSQERLKAAELAEQQRQKVAGGQNSPVPAQ